MIQLVGILVIVNTLVVSAWWLSQGKPWGLGFTTLAVLASLVGLALVFNERAIELSFGKFGKIKAAAQQAETDAKEIAEIRKRVEAQAATMDLVAKESAEAKKLLADLTEQNEVAERKLKELAERTSEVVRLPDGRTKFGNIITGVPSVLKEEFEKGISAYQKKDNPVAFKHFSECISIFEETEKTKGKVTMTSGGATPDSVANIYALGAEVCQRLDKHDLALQHAQKAVGTISNGARKALLVTCLMNAGKTSEATTLIKETLEEDNDESKKFKKLLVRIGVLKENQSNKAMDSDKK